MEHKVIEVEMNLKWKCHFCHCTFIKGIAIAYMSDDLFLALSCLSHPRCKSFSSSGKFCSNHSDRIIGDCNVVPF